MRVRARNPCPCAGTAMRARKTPRSNQLAPRRPSLGLLPRGLTGPANVKRDGVLCGPAIPGHLGIWPIHPRDGDFSFPLSPSPFPRPLLLGAPSPFSPPWRRVRHGVGGAPRQGAGPVEVVAGVAPCDYCSWLVVSSP